MEEEKEREESRGERKRGEEQGGEERRKTGWLEMHSLNHIFWLQ